MRGKEKICKCYNRIPGITPAYAGKSNICILRPCWIRDHPRLCGEKPSALSDQNLVPGSPPPMRGKVTVQCDAMDHGGITPAYAGKRKTLIDEKSLK